MAKSLSTKKETPKKKDTAKKKTVKKEAPKKAVKKVAAKKATVKKVSTAKTPVKKTAQKKDRATTAKTIKNIADNEFLALTVAQGMYEKKAENIKILDLRKVKGASTDFFVISHAGNDKQVEAIAQSIEEEVKKLTGQTPWHREGFANLHWVLIDYIDVVAHVFLEEKRNFYDIESLWGDAAELPFRGK